MTTDTLIYTILAIAAAGLILYAIQINTLMATGPAEAERIAGAPLTVEQIEAVRDRLREQPINYERFLPSFKQRRYIVVGGSGTWLNQPTLCAMSDL